MHFKATNTSQVTKIELWAYIYFMISNKMNHKNCVTGINTIATKTMKQSQTSYLNESSYKIMIANYFYSQIFKDKITLSQTENYTTTNYVWILHLVTKIHSVYLYQKNNRKHYKDYRGGRSMQNLPPPISRNLILKEKSLIYVKKTFDYSKRSHNGPLYRSSLTFHRSGNLLSNHWRTERTQWAEALSCWKYTQSLSSKSFWFL